MSRGIKCHFSPRNFVELLISSDSIHVTSCAVIEERREYDRAIVMGLLDATRPGHSALFTINNRDQNAEVIQRFHNSLNSLRATGETYAFCIIWLVPLAASVGWSVFK